MSRFVNIGVLTATPGNLFPNAEGVGQHAARQEWGPTIGIRRKRPVCQQRKHLSAGMLDKKGLTQFKSEVRS